MNYKEYTTKKNEFFRHSTIFLLGIMVNYKNHGELK
jgi:hypothetical protein